MKIRKMIAILLPILVGIPALTGCNNNDVEKPNPPTPDIPVEPEETITPISIDDFFNKINKGKNYTYTYEFVERKDEEHEFKTTFKYVDKFTTYGMYSKAIIETSKEHSNLAWASDSKQGTYKLDIDENGNINPGRAIRDGDRENIPNYYNEIIALDDLLVEDLDAKLYKKNNNYRINDIEAKGAILEASQLNPDAAKETKMEIILNLENEKKVTIHGDLGKNRYFDGEITDLGTTEIPEVKSYIESGKGPFIKTEVDPELQGIIDAFNTFNYSAPLYGSDDGSGTRPEIGITKVYKKVLNDKTAIVKFNDYKDEKTVDDGLIEIETPSEHATYNFTLVDGQIKLGTQAMVKNKPMVSFLDEYCFELPNSLSAFNEDVLILDYDNINKMFLTYDTYVTVEFCIFYDLVYSLQFTSPLCSVINPIYSENNSLETVELRYYWQHQDGRQPYTSNFFSNFGKINLPFVDAFLEAK